MWRFKSAPNFRPLMPDGNGKPEVPLYRSGRITELTDEDWERYQQLGIRTYIDLRAQHNAGFPPNINRRIPKIWSNSSIRSVVLPPQGYKGNEPIEMATKYLKGPETDGGQTSNDSASTTHFTPNYLFIKFVIFAHLRDLAKNFSNWSIWKPIILLVLCFDGLWNYFRPETGFKKTFLTYLAFGFCFNVIDMDLTKFLINLLDFNSQAVIAVLKIMSEPENLPAVVSCEVGKDRTGVTSAIIQRILGKSNQYIAEEYAKSADNLVGYREAMVRKFHSSVTDGIRQFFDTQGYQIIAALDHIDKKYGSLDRYLDLNGFDEEHRQKLRRNLQNKQSTL